MPRAPWLTSNVALGVLPPGHTLASEFPVSQVGRDGGGSPGEGGGDTVLLNLAGRTSASNTRLFSYLVIISGINLPKFHIRFIIIKCII